MLFDYHGTDRLMICMDPANLDLLRDFCSDRATTRILEIQCDFPDDYLVGHARRMGLAGDHTSAETLARLLPTIRNDIRYESDQIREARFENLYTIRQSASIEENTVPLTGFLSIAEAMAREIAAHDHLFAD